MVQSWFKSHRYLRIAMRAARHRTLCRRRGVGTAALAAVILACWTSAYARVVVDSAGRSVEIPDGVERVQAAGPPASVLLYVLAPEKFIGWVRKPRPAELPFLNPVVRNLPEIGRLTGRGDTANLEAVIKAKPDVIIDFGSVNPTYVSLADRVQNQTGIPYLLVDGRFAYTVAGLRLVGDVIDVQPRAQQLAAKAAEILSETDQIAAAVSTPERPRVYLARQANGLQTGNRGSINTEIIERAGGINVVEGGRETGGLVNVSLESVIVWNPDTIITVDANFYDSVRSNPGWLDVAAVKEDRVFLSPNLPYGWTDEPPSVNRLLGLQWLGRLFFPQRFSHDMRMVTRDFYKLFYQVELNDADVDAVLRGARRNK
jgi:iron complex transport system substrate-binding protein